MKSERQIRIELGRARTQIMKGPTRMIASYRAVAETLEWVLGEAKKRPSEMPTTRRIAGEGEGGDAG